MAKINRLIISGIALMIIFLLVACNGLREAMVIIPYNAVVYSKPNETRSWLKDDFYEKNLTYGAWSSIQIKYVEDAAYPQLRTLIIAEQEEFNTAFKEFPVKVDFEKEMVVMYGRTTMSGDELVLTDILLNDQKLYIKYRFPVYKGPPPINGSQPLTKWAVVKMDKLDVMAAEFAFDT